MYRACGTGRFLLFEAVTYSYSRPELPERRSQISGTSKNSGIIPGRKYNRGPEIEGKGEDRGGVCTRRAALREINRSFKK